MTLNLTKGQKVELTKDNPGLKNIKIGLGWDVNRYSGGQNFDLDTSAFLLNNAGKCASEKDVIYFNNLKHASGSVIHSGDNLTGAGEGDDEIITIDLMKVPIDFSKIVFVINIYSADERKQNFGMVSNCFGRVIDDSGKELLKYELGEDYSTETGVIICEVYRHNNEWKFFAVGQGFRGGLGEISKNFGLN